MIRIVIINLIWIDRSLTSVVDEDVDLAELLISGIHHIYDLLRLSRLDFGE